MGKRLHFLFPAIFLAVICMSGKANAQAFELYTIQEDMFPTVEAFIYAEDPSGAPISGAAFKVEDFNVSENGTPVTAASPYNLRVECVENEYQSPVNVVFALDISTSMDEDAGNGETRYDWVKYAMSEFLDSLKLQPPGGVCIMPFAGNTRDNSGFQTDRDILNQFLKDLPTADGLTKFDRAFMNVPPQQKPGAIWLLEQRPADIRRVIIFLTDGRHESQIPFDENPVWAKCKDEGIEVYSITIGLSMEPDLREISQETGGKEYAIWDKDVLVSTMWDIVGRIQKQDICKLVWEAPLACEGDNLDRNVEITYNPLTLSDASTYTVPPSGVTELLISETKLLFGAPGVGTNQRTFDLTSTKGTIAIESMSIVPSAADFTVEPAPPFNVIEGTPTTVTVTYTADPAGDPGEYTLSYSGTPCSPEPLTLIAPCGGQYTEQFDFGQVANNTVKPHTLTEVFVNNTPEIIVGDAQLSGADAAMFNLKSGGGPFTLSPSQALTVEVEFSPTSLGAKSAQIDYNIANGAVCGSPSTLLSGESISTDFPITDYSFGMIRVNHTENYTYNLTNNTQAPANITKIELIDNADGNFALGNDPTGLIDPAQSVDLIINYTPKDAGPHECILQITVEDLSAPVEATISGIGGLPVLDVETELQFGQYKLGETSNEMTLTLTNTGNMDLHIESVSDISGEFIFVGSPNLTDITIPANNGQESFELTFTPTQAGQRTDVIEISHDAVEGPEPVTYQTSTVDLIGYGLSLEINPKSIDFEEVLTCNTAQEVVTIPNSGTEDTDVTVS
ncbi:MAG: choice-of-anchor D domain-containing protein, partial [Bacteroidota bacterium]